MSSEHVEQFIDTFIELIRNDLRYMLDYRDDIDFLETEEQREKLQKGLENLGQACEEMDYDIAWEVGRMIAADEYDDRVAQGVATLPAGATEVIVEYDLPQPPESVIITPQGEPADHYWVEDIGEGNFTIITLAGPAASLDFSWVALVPEGFQQEGEE